MKFKALLATLLLVGGSQAQTWNFDAVHSNVGFAIKHLAVSTAHGTFDKVEAKLSGDPKKPSSLAAEVTIQAASVNTRVDKRDEHIRSPDFFDVAMFPTITFKSEKVEFKNGKDMMVGTLTLHGVSKKIEIPFELSGPVVDPWKNNRIGFEGAFSLNRQDYGIAGGGVAVGDEVKIEISAEFTQAAGSVQSPPPAKK